MKKVLTSIAAVLIAVVTTATVAQAQEQVTGNIVGGNWSGVVPYSGTGAGYSGGNVPGYNSSNNTIYFGYTQSTVAQTIAINQALQGSGILVNGYNWSWTITNGNIGGTTSAPGNLTANINTFSNTGSLLHNFSQSYSGIINNQTFSGSQTYTNPYQLGNLGNLSVQFSGKDGSFWAGYYGPQVSNVSIGLRYGADPCTVDPQSSPTCPNYRTYYTMYDDTYAHVPLPFAFPFYGRLFTNSWMHSNGLVSFLDPLSTTEPNAGQWAYCCGGPDLSQNTSGHGPMFNYVIAPFWTDLYPDQDSRIYTTKGSNWIKYHWDSVPDISNSANRNTFNLELGSSGSIAAAYGNIMSQQQVTAGTIGNLGLGEKTHSFFGIPGTMGINNWSLTGTQAADCSNPLINPNCPGYAEAYFNQQCTVNALYNPSCPGYAAAYFTQQCTANPLYNVNCPGYATAYYNYQCSANPLYHTGCPGYEQAYFTQQCTANPLYSVNCSGYQTAYFNQQCSLNPLYDSRCPGYADAYYVQQCTANPLYDVGCTGYAQAYFTQQCNLDGLYDRSCPNYAEAFAKKNILNIGSTSPSTGTTTTESSTISTGSTIVLAQANSDPVAQAAPVVADPVVNNVVTTRSTATNSEASPAAAVRLTQPAPAATTTAVTAAAAAQEKKEEKKTEEKKEEKKSESSGSTTASSSSSTDNKNEPKSNRQALAERRLEAARAKAVEEGKNLAGKMGEAATMEAQVAVQNVVVQAMGFTPGFDAYGKVVMPDAAGYRPFEIYKGQRNVDNPAGRRFMTGSDRLHTEMVDQQYNLTK